MQISDERAESIEILHGLRATLQQERYSSEPDDVYTSSVHTSSFNYAVNNLEDELGDEWTIEMMWSVDRTEDDPADQDVEFPRGIVKRNDLIAEIDRALADLEGND